MRRVTLSFDNGPTPVVTESVLEILDRAAIPATFFVIGAKLEDPAAAAMMQAAHRAGHWIGNHTLTHSIAFGDQPDAAYAATEIGETQRRIGALAHPDKLFRPYGKSGAIGPHLFSKTALAYLLEHRYCALLWNNVPGDWRDPEYWVDRCVADARNCNWSAIVLHDIAGACLPRLPELIARLIDLDVEWRRDFPEAVVMTRDGERVSLDAAYVADGRE
jgi:peptidoglycan-N-acetylglucosamine deacetylase